MSLRRQIRLPASGGNGTPLGRLKDGRSVELRPPVAPLLLAAIAAKNETMTLANAHIAGYCKQRLTGMTRRSQEGF
jgi:hypothetical protein